MTVIGIQAYPTPNETRDILLRTIAWAFARRGLIANVLPGSDHFIRAEAYAKRVAIAIANGQIAQQDFSPLTATGDALTALAGVFGVIRRPASQSAGPLIIRCLGTVIIPAGFQATAPNGKKYQVVALSTRTTLQSVEVISVDGGLATRQGEGVRMTWDSAAIGALDPIATVGAGGITGGREADNDERLRERLILRLAFPPVGGNWSSVVQWAEEASASVEAAYCYGPAQGPASYDVAVTAAGSDRTLGSTTLGVIEAYVNGRMPGQNRLNVTTVAPQAVDATVVASLSLPQVASGGWRDQAPWPAETTKVTAYNSGTGTATVDATETPTVGKSIGIWDPDAVDADGLAAPVMKEFVILTVGGVANAWTITVQGGFGFTPTGAYVSAGAVRLTEYADEIWQQFLLLGPGEKTDSPELLPLALRRPTTSAQAPSAITNNILSEVIEAHDEVADMSWGVRYATGTTTPLTAPNLPAATSDPPRIITLRYLAIHR